MEQIPAALTTENMDLGTALKSIRKELKVSRVELAKRSDLSVTALYNIENNISFPPKETIEKLCSSLHIPVSYLMLYSLTEDDVPDDKRQFFKLAVGPVKAFLMGK
jgi:transcriptional regulator with XRE-family HTH domain